MNNMNKLIIPIIVIAIIVAGGGNRPNYFKNRPWTLKN